MEEATGNKRTYQVTEQIKKLVGAADNLDRLISQLGQRLDSVLLAEVPLVAPKESEKDLEVPLASEIAEIKEQILNRTRDLQSILDRIEL